MRVITARISLYTGDVFLDVARRQRANVPPGLVDPLGFIQASILWAVFSSPKSIHAVGVQKMCCCGARESCRHPSVASSSVAEQEKWCHHNRSVSHWDRLKLALSVMHNSLSNLSVCSLGFLTLVAQRTHREMKVRHLSLANSGTPILPKCPFNLCRQPQPGPADI